MVRSHEMRCSHAPAAIALCSLLLLSAPAVAETWLEAAEDQLTCTTFATAAERAQLGDVLMQRPFEPGTGVTDRYFIAAPRDSQHEAFRYMLTLAALAWTADRTNDQQLRTELYLAIGVFAQRYAQGGLGEIFDHISRCARTTLISAALEADNPSLAAVLAYDLAEKYRGGVRGTPVADWPLLRALKEISLDPEAQKGTLWLLVAAAERGKAVESQDAKRAARLYTEVAAASLALNQADKAQGWVTAALQRALADNDKLLVLELVPVLYDVWDRLHGPAKAAELTRQVVARFPVPDRFENPETAFAVRLRLARIALHDGVEADARRWLNLAKDAAVDGRQQRLSMRFLRDAYRQLFEVSDLLATRERAAIAAAFDKADEPERRAMQQRLSPTLAPSATKWINESKQLFVSDARDQLYAGERFDASLDMQYWASQQFPGYARESVDLSFRMAQVRAYSRLTPAAVASRLQSQQLDRRSRLTIERFFEFSTQNSVFLRDWWGRLDAPTERAPPGERIGNVIFALGSLFRETAHGLDASIALLHARAPELAGLALPNPLPLAQFQALLRDDEALVTTVVASKRLFVWGISRHDAVFVAHPIDQSRVADLVRRLRASLRARHASGNLSVPPFDAAAAYELHNLTIGSVGRVLDRARHVFWYGHDVLGSIPPGVLVTSAPKRDSIQAAADFAGTHFVADRFALSVLADMSLLAVHRTPAPQVRYSQSFLGIGAPLLSMPELENTSTARSLELAGGYDGASLAAMPKLRDAAVELRNLAGLFGERDATLWLGADARETRFETAALSGYRFIAFATHGFTPGEISREPEAALMLALEPGRRDRFEGLLTAREIASLKLNAQLVILSACNTASPDGRPRGTAFSGLAQAFLTAGARSVLVSHWPVASRAASQLSVRTMERSVRDRVPLAQSLQTAMRSMRTDAASDVEAHPFYWGPFVLAGDGLLTLEQ